MTEYLNKQDIEKLSAQNKITGVYDMSEREATDYLISKLPRYVKMPSRCEWADLKTLKPFVDPAFQTDEYIDYYDLLKLLDLHNLNVLYFVYGQITPTLK